MCNGELAAAITTLAVVLAKDKSTNEIELLAAVLTQLGDTLATIAAQKALCESV